jgi:hypothetical protein
MHYFFSKKSKLLIFIGVLGCLLTSTAGISAVMIFDGWHASGGFTEFFRRLGIAYPFACIVVIIVFPWMIPFLMHKFE